MFAWWPGYGPFLFLAAVVCRKRNLTNENAGQVLSMAYNITSLLSRFTLPAVAQPGTKLTFHNSFKVYKFGGGYHLWEIGDQDYRGFLKARPPSSPLAAFVVYRQSDTNPGSHH